MTSDASITDDREKPKKTETGWSLLLSLGIAVALALLIRFYLVEIFVIPSGSMEPTLHGRPEGGDRVLCTKTDYLFRQPRRWEIFVFKFPYTQAKNFNPGSDYREFEGQNFIKRCVGLPGETIRIARGDIFVKKPLGERFVRAIKPDKMQRSLWIPVYGEDFSDLRQEEFELWWRQSGEKGWSVTGKGTLAVDAAAGSHLTYLPCVRGGDGAELRTELDAVYDRYVLRQYVTFRCPDCAKDFVKTVADQKIVGRCPHCDKYLRENHVTFYGRRSDLPTFGAVPDSENWIRQGERGDGKYRTISFFVVPDLRAILKARFSPGATVSVSLLDDGNILRADVSSRGQAALFLNGRNLPNARVEIPPLGEGWHDVEFYQADTAARLFVGGKLLIECLVPQERDPLPSDLARRSGVIISAAGGRLELDDLRIDRDIYYFSGREPARSQTGRHGYPRFDPEGSTLLDKDGYLALGDNCPSSNDSRNWGKVPAASLRGPARFRWWPPHRLEWFAIPDGE